MHASQRQTTTCNRTQGGRRGALTRRQQRANRSVVARLLGDVLRRRPPPTPGIQDMDVCVYMLPAGEEHRGHGVGGGGEEEGALGG